MQVASIWPLDILGPDFTENFFLASMADAETVNQSEQMLRKKEADAILVVALLHSLELIDGMGLQSSLFLNVHRSIPDF